MLSVVHIYKDSQPVRGGIERHVEVLTRQLAAGDVRAEVLCSRSPGPPVVSCARDRHTSLRERWCSVVPNRRRLLHSARRLTAWRLVNYAAPIGETRV